jgi:hypothetical protein
MIEYKVVVADKDKFWYLNGKRHREDGPAIEHVNGTNFWFIDGKLHREDGPAIEYADGTKFWYLDGINYPESEFHVKLNQSKELTITEIEKLLGYSITIVK